MKKISSLSDQHQQKELLKLIGEPDLPKAEKKELLAFQADHHETYLALMMESMGRLT